MASKIHTAFQSASNFVYAIVMHPLSVHIGISTQSLKADFELIIEWMETESSLGVHSCLHGAYCCSSLLSSRARE